jgi:hypothetical protein
MNRTFCDWCGKELPNKPKANFIRAFFTPLYSDVFGVWIEAQELKDEICGSCFKDFMAWRRAKGKELIA